MAESQRGGFAEFAQAEQQDKEARAQAEQLAEQERLGAEHAAEEERMNAERAAEERANWANVAQVRNRQAELDVFDTLSGRPTNGHETRQSAVATERRILADTSLSNDPRARERLADEYEEGIRTLTESGLELWQARNIAEDRIGDHGEMLEMANRFMAGKAGAQYIPVHRNVRQEAAESGDRPVDAEAEILTLSEDVGARDPNNTIMSADAAMARAQALYARNDARRVRAARLENPYTRDAEIEANGEPTRREQAAIERSRTAVAHEVAASQESEPIAPVATPAPAAEVQPAAEAVPRVTPVAEVAPTAQTDDERIVQEAADLLRHKYGDASPEEVRNFLEEYVRDQNVAEGGGQLPVDPDDRQRRADGRPRDRYIRPSIDEVAGSGLQKPPGRNTLSSDDNGLLRPIVGIPARGSNEDLQQESALEPLPARPEDDDEYDPEFDEGEEDTRNPEPVRDNPNRRERLARHRRRIIVGAVGAVALAAGIGSLYADLRYNGGAGIATGAHATPRLGYIPGVTHARMPGVSAPAVGGSLAPVVAHGATSANTYNLPAGSNPWDLSRAILENRGNAAPTVPEIHSEDLKIGRNRGYNSWSQWVQAAKSLRPGKYRG